MSVKNLTGKVFTHLTVIGDSGLRSRSREVLWSCQCVCGKTVNLRTGTLKVGNNKSCGCKQAELVSTHGMYGTPTHNSWRTMIERCTKGYHKSFERYKDKEIDQNWLSSFEAFHADMGDRPEGTTLDRRNNNEGYNKENCRWATGSIQQQNKEPNYINKNKGLAGVFESNGKYCARIRYDGKREYLGTFLTPEAANDAYNNRGREVFGENWINKGQKK